MEQTRRKGCSNIIIPSTFILLLMVFRRNCVKSTVMEVDTVGVARESRLLSRSAHNS